MNECRCGHAWAENSSSNTSPASQRQERKKRSLRHNAKRVCAVCVGLSCWWGRSGPDVSRNQEEDRIKSKGS